MKTAKYALGLDFGTNSVRALVVDISNGDEVGTAIFDYPSGAAGILLDPKDANLARQNPADWILRHRRRRARGPGRGQKEGQGLRPRRRHRHRRRHDRLDSPARRPGRQAAGPLQGVQEEPRTPWPGSGRTTPDTPKPRRSRPWPPPSTPSTWPSAAGPIPPNGSGARSSTACGRTRRSPRPPCPGSSAPTTSPASSPGSPIRCG